MPTYVVFFDTKEQKERPATLFGAIDMIWKHLEFINVGYLREIRKSDVAWISTDNGSQGVCRITKMVAYQTLRDSGEIRLYCECTSCGIFYTCGAQELSRYQRRCLVHKPQVSKKANKLVEQTRQAETQFVRLLGHDDAATYWEPYEVNPVQILNSAEDRIFGFNLYHAIKASRKRMEEIEREAGFANQTLLAMMSAINPLRPTAQQVDQLARILRVKPDALWHPLVKDYLDSTNGWQNYIGDAHASM